MSRANAQEIVDIDSTLARAVGVAVASPTPSRSQRISAAKLPLDSIESCRREMSRVYREMRANTLPAQAGTRLVYVLSEIGKLLVLGQLEQRIEALEGNAAAFALTNDLRENNHGQELAPQD